MKDKEKGETPCPYCNKMSIIWSQDELLWVCEYEECGFASYND